jgi:hypothetical protein
MSRSLPERRIPHNGNALSAAPSAFVVLASRPEGADRSEVLLRDTVVGSRSAVVALAHLLLPAAVHRFGAGVDVQVLDSGNVPLYCATSIAAGGAR